MDEVKKIALFVNGEEVDGTLTNLVRRMISPDKAEHITVAEDRLGRQADTARRAAAVIAAVVDELRTVTEGVHSPEARTLNAAATNLEATKFTLRGFASSIGG